jgi:rSAM/selenodomain-associated transferase 1
MTSSAPRPERTRIAVFGKAPVPGAVKTRLAPLLGIDGAAGLHAGLLRHALATAVQSRVGPVDLWCAPDTHHEFFTRCAGAFGVGLERQEGADLGERMKHAADAALSRGEAIVIIGADCPCLDVMHLHDVAAALASHDAVVIPAEDGGYVLIALSRDVPSVFEGIAWGGPAVMAQTRARLEGAGVRAKELPAMWDVDRPEDYARLAREGLLDTVMS